jgi:hypothetical protein
MVVSQQKWELDTQAYLNVCNITAELPRQQIRDFSKRVNDLGLWNSMVCWPLRSSQNAATGNIMYSLGGLGTFNGTMTNGPVRGADGMTFANASSQYISFGSSQIIGGNSAYTLFGVAKLTNMAVANLSVISFGNNRGSLLQAASNGSTQGRFTAWNNSGLSFSVQLANGPTTSMFSQFAAGDATDVRFFMNSGSPFNTQSGDARTNPDPVNASTLERIGGHTIFTNNALFWNGDIAAGAIWNVKLTNAQVASVLTAYKETLGQGLLLP